MKGFMGYFRTDLRAFVKSGAWLIGMAGVAASLFFSLASDGFYFNNVVELYVFATWMSGSLAAYVFCAFPYAAVFSGEMEHKYSRCAVIRGSLKGYVLSKAAVIYFSAVLTMLGGTMLFLLLCRTQLPWLNVQEGYDYGTLYSGCYSSILKAGKPFVYCMLGALNMGLLSGTLSVFAALCSLYISNRMLVLIIPVLLFDLLAAVNFNGYDVYIFYQGVKIWNDGTMNFLFLFLLSVIPVLLLTAGIYLSMKRKL